MAITSDQLIDAGVRRGLLDSEVVTRLRIEARRDRVDVLDALAAHYRFPVASLYQALAELRGLPYVQPVFERLPMDLIRKLPQALVQRKLVLPVEKHEDSVVVALVDPDDRTSLETVQRILGLKLRQAMSDLNSLSTLIARVYAAGSQALLQAAWEGERDAALGVGLGMGVGGAGAPPSCPLPFPAPQRRAQRAGHVPRRPRRSGRRLRRCHCGGGRGRH